MTSRLLTAIALLGLMITFAAGCGSSDEGDPIPAEVRDQLDQRLQQAQDRLDNGSAGACRDIQTDTEPAVGDILDGIPESVDPDVRNALNEGFARLFDLTDQRCDELESKDTETQPDTTETQTETTPPDTTETETTPTETTDTETTPTEPTETTPPPDTGGDTGGGSGGVGNGGGADGGVQVPDPGGGSTPPGQDG